MNNFNAFNAGINQQQADFGNVLNARSSLYSGPIALEQGQNQADVARGLGISSLAQGNANAQNGYNMTNNQGFNNYNMNANQGQNQFSLGRYNGQNQSYGIQQQANTAQRGQNLGFIGGLANTVVGQNGLF